MRFKFHQLAGAEDALCLPLGRAVQRQTNPIIRTTTRLDSGWWTSEKQFAMESEIVTLKLIPQSTDVPVPRAFAIHTYNTGPDKNP